MFIWSACFVINIHIYQIGTFRHGNQIKIFCNLEILLVQKLIHLSRDHKYWHFAIWIQYHSQFVPDIRNKNFIIWLQLFYDKRPISIMVLNTMVLWLPAHFKSVVTWHARPSTCEYTCEPSCESLGTESEDEDQSNCPGAQQNKIAWAWEDAPHTAPRRAASIRAGRRLTALRISQRWM